MNPFKSEPEVEISATSGTLRVTVHPKTHWVSMLVQAAVIVAFGVALFRGWAGMSLPFRGLVLWAMVGAVIAWFYQLSGSEVVEIDATKIAIRKDIFGWERRSEYPIQNCRELEWRQQNEDDQYGLQCKIGWKTVRFGEYISEDKAIQILTVLQNELPDVAQKLLAYPDSGKKHFITLDLG